MTNNNLNIGSGIFTAAEISKILKLPYRRINRWINLYCENGMILFEYSNSSFNKLKVKAVNFHTLIELQVMSELSEAGISTNKIAKAKNMLSKLYNTPFPFANKEILENLRVNGNKIYFDEKGDVFVIDDKLQFSLEFIKSFIHNIEFDTNMLARKYMPLGKSKSIIVDPTRQFGHPVVGDTNIYPETFFNLYNSGESIEFIASLYNVDKKAIEDALEYCQVA